LVGELELGAEAEIDGGINQPIFTGTEEAGDFEASLGGSTGGAALERVGLGEGGGGEEEGKTGGKGEAIHGKWA